jgi:nucleobase:cation symporter-1, NCS1 family
MAATISAEAVGEDAVGMLSNQVPGLSSVILLAIVIGAVPAGAYGAYGMYPSGAVDSPSGMRPTASKRLVRSAPVSVSA